MNVGGTCRGDRELCCSGIREGTKPKKGKRDRGRRVAHNVQGCQPEFNNRGGDGAVRGEASACFRTTGEASFRGDLEAGGACMVCRKDTDCEAIEGPGAACIVCEGLACPETGTSCMPAAA